MATDHKAGVRVNMVPVGLCHLINSMIERDLLRLLADLACCRLVDLSFCLVRMVNEGAILEHTWFGLANIWVKYNDRSKLIDALTFGFGQDRSSLSK